MTAEKGYAGPAWLCSVDYEPIAGHRASIALVMPARLDYSTFPGMAGGAPLAAPDGLTSWAGEVRNVSLPVAIGVNESGYREIVGICEGAKEDKTGWSASRTS